MRVPVPQASLTFCADCGTRLPRGAKGCPRCGAIQPQKERPIAVMVFAAVCLLSAAVFAYSLVFNGSSDGPKHGAALTLTELDLEVPPGWHYRDLTSGYVMAQYDDDLDVEDPRELRGPQLRITRERQARSNPQREAQRPVLRSDIADGVKDDTYGSASELIGSEVRFVRESVDGDLVGVSYYLTGSNPLGQAYVIAYYVPAAQEARYAGALRAFLASLTLFEEETE